MELQVEGLRITAFKRGVAALKNAGIQNPVVDAAVLLGYVTGQSSSTVLLDRNSTLEPVQSTLYSILLEKRCGRIAVSRLIGNREFYTRDFQITDDVLDPRPETEILVEEAIRCLEDQNGRSCVLDVGTGSGAIAVTIAAEVKGVRVTATDISKTALDVARRNAERHAVLDRVSFIQADLLNGFRKEGYFHAILSNPPYVSCAQFQGLQEEVREGDPMMALVSGPDGTEYYPPLVNRSMELLVRNGNLMVEVGAGQAGVVAGMFEDAGFKEVVIVNDLSGTGRVVRGKKENA